MLARMRHSAARVPMCDASKPSADPTGTADIRKRNRTLLDLRWRKVINAFREAILKQDMIGLNPNKPTMLGLALASMPFDVRTKAFQTFVDATLNRIVLENEAAYLDPMIEKTYQRAMVRAQRLSRQVVPPTMRPVIHNLQQLVVVELQGISEAVSQRLVRLAANAQLDGTKPATVFAQMKSAVETIGITRSRAMVSVMVVKTHAQATLDTFEAAGVKRVVGLPETVRPKMFKDADEVANPGSRVSRKRTPSASTIGRITRAEKKVERKFKAEEIEVITAGDDLVCPECEDIAADGPYSIDEARSLIPAHPECRCAFVPESEVEGLDEED